MFFDFWTDILTPLNKIILVFILLYKLFSITSKSNSNHLEDKYSYNLSIFDPLEGYHFHKLKPILSGRNTSNEDKFLISLIASLYQDKKGIILLSFTIAFHLNSGIFKKELIKSNCFFIGKNIFIF